MEINSLLEQLEEVVINAKHVPLANSVIISDKVLFDLIDEMKRNIPEEIKQARWIVKERQEIVNEAQKEATRILDESKAKAEEIISEMEITRAAHEKSEQILEDAKNKEREIRLGAEDYADEMLANLEVSLGKLLTAVQRGRDRLQGKIETR